KSRHFAFVFGRTTGAVEARCHDDISAWRQPVEAIDAAIIGWAWLIGSSRRNDLSLRITHPNGAQGDAGDRRVTGIYHFAGYHAAFDEHDPGRFAEAIN